MKVYSPYLKMKYSKRTKELSMTKETLVMWLTTWEQCSAAQRENILKALNNLAKNN